MGQTQARKAGCNNEKNAVGDLVLKIMVPAMLLVFFVVSLRYGSLDGYLQLFKQPELCGLYSGPGRHLYLDAAAFSGGAHGFYGACISRIPCHRVNYPKSPSSSPLYNEGAMVEKSIYAVTAADYSQR